MGIILAGFGEDWSERESALTRRRDVDPRDVVSRDSCIDRRQNVRAHVRSFARRNLHPAIFFRRDFILVIISTVEVIQLYIIIIALLQLRCYRPI